MSAIGFRIIRISDRDGFQQWDEAVESIPISLRDVHLSAGYAAAQQHLGVDPVLAIYESHSYRVIQPFALRKVLVEGIEAMDVANLYGYGGPVGNHSWQLYAWFHDALMKWFEDIGVVSEFCALNPMVGDHQKQLVGGNVALVERKPVVVMDLRQLPGHGYRDRRRAGIKAALSAGITVGISRNWAYFAQLYTDTMMRKGASHRWLFSKEYIEQLCQIGVLFSAGIDGGIIESMALMLTSASGDAYYHLAANALIHPKSGANDLLVHEMANHARAIGMKRLHLGGGVTSAPDDSVLSYKAGFSDMRLPTCSYFRVFDDRKYRDLCLAKISQEIAETGAELASGFLPLYRREAS